MGQGNYLQVLVGIFPSAELCKRLKTEDEDWLWYSLGIPKSERLAREDEPRTSYESDTQYIGFRVAGSNGVSGDLALEDVGSGLLAELPAAMEQHAGPARARWARFEAWTKTRGIDMPEPALLFVADYDL